MHGPPTIPAPLFCIPATSSLHALDYTVKVTYLELYNEEIRDLLAPEGQAVQEGMEKKGLQLQEGSDGRVQVKGVKEETVKSTDEVFELLHKGSSRRRTAETDLNARSRYAASSRHGGACMIPLGSPR